MCTKRFLFGLMAVAMLGSCTNEIEPQPPQGDKEKNYVAFSICANNEQGRASSGGYDEGTAAENGAANAQFFFFKANGDAFVVNDASQTNGAVNYVTASITGSGKNMDNVERIYDAVVVIKNNKGEVPAKVIAVLNWNYAGSSLSMSQLQAQVVENYQTTNGFLMSNSVYSDNGVHAEAVTITAANLAGTADAAKNVPVEIYVERVAAKVAVSQADGISNGVKVYDAIMSDGTTKAIYAKVEGWDLNGTIDKSYLTKHIDLSWTDATLFIGWNDAPNYRSYWATTTADGVLSHEFSWNSLTGVVGGDAKYCLENTGKVVAGDVAVENMHVACDNATKVLVAASLYEDASCTTPAKIANWYGSYYAMSDMPTNVANSVNLYTSADNGVSYTKITPADIELVAVTNTSASADDYKVTYQLTSAAASNKWYSKGADGTTFTELDADGIAAVFAAVEKALVWNGKSYYIVNIEHLGALTADDADAPTTWTITPASYGVVRNHSYVINITGIEGLGTPVYDPDQVVFEPEIPAETESFIAAKINVLSWKLVNQNVVLK